MPTRMQKIWNSHLWLGGMQCDIFTLKNSLAVWHKVKCAPIRDPTISLFSSYQSNENTCPCKDLHVDVHDSLFIIPLTVNIPNIHKLRNSLINWDTSTWWTQQLKGIQKYGCLQNILLRLHDCDIPSTWHSIKGKSLGSEIRLVVARNSG